MFSSRVAFAARIALGGLLLWAGVVKLTAPGEFFGALLGYEVPLPHQVWRLLAISAPWLEIIVGASLVFGIWRETIYPIACLLCLAFVLMLGQALLRGLDISCGCFGAGGGGRAGTILAFVRATALFGGSVYLLLRPAAEPRRG